MAFQVTVGNASDNTISDKEWLEFLDKNASLGVDDYKQACNAFVKAVEPVQEVVNSQQERNNLARRVRESKKKSQSSQVAIISGDRVLVKSSQYASTVGNGKFVCRDGNLAEFIVQKVSNVICELSEIGSGKLSIQHESMLKVLPNALPAEQG